jgi:hypothetical protein
LFSKAKTTLSGTEDLEVESINDAQAAGTTGKGDKLIKAERKSLARNCSMYNPEVLKIINQC